VKWVGNALRDKATATLLKKAATAKDAKAIIMAQLKNYGG
jgi:hypothetical protein